MPKNVNTPLISNLIGLFTYSLRLESFRVFLLKLFMCENTSHSDQADESYPWANVMKAVQTNTWTLLGILLLPCIVRAQFYNNGNQIRITNGGVLYVKGDLINADSSIYNDGNIYVEGHCIVKNKPTSRILISINDSLAVSGDFKDSSKFGQNSGVLVLKGTNQAIGSTSNILANLVLNGAGDKTLLSNIYVRFNLFLKNGYVIPNSYLFGLDSTGSISPGLVTSASYVAGNMARKRKLGVEDSLFFPIGTKTDYRPATLLGIGTVAGKHPVYTMGTGLATSPQPGLEVSTIFKRIWGLSATDTTIPISNMKLFYLPADVSATPPANLVVAQSQASNGTYSSIGNMSATSTYVVSELKPKRSGYFALGSSNNLRANFRLLLEGPFNGSTMTPSLSTNSVLTDQLLPTIGMLPGYSVPTDAVDRIGFIAQDSATLAYADTAYAWLISDGSIRDYATGTRSYVTFSKATATTRYFMIAQHRNHLPASSKSILLSSSIPSGWSYDYTKGVYGGGALYQLGPNVWTLYASDPYKSSKNQTDVIDLVRVSDDNDAGTYRQTGLYYYRYTDLNLDGVVNANDRQIANNHNNKLYYSTLK